MRKMLSDNRGQWVNCDSIWAPQALSSTQVCRSSRESRLPDLVHMACAVAGEVTKKPQLLVFVKENSPKLPFHSIWCHTSSYNLNAMGPARTIESSFRNKTQI